MDCLALHENSSNGEYWANATHFLYCFQAFNYPFHCLMATALMSESFNLEKLIRPSKEFNDKLHNVLKKVRNLFSI